MRGLQKVNAHSHLRYGILGIVVACLPQAVLRAVANLDHTHRAWLELVVAVMVVNAVVIVVAELKRNMKCLRMHGGRGDNQRWG
jgi:undecaprenyl pyrophosphate phosphatase UppP